MGNNQTTTPGTLCPTLYDECVGSLTTPADHNLSENAGDRAVTVYRPYPKTLEHLTMLLQRQHILLSYFKTPSVGLAWSLNARPLS